MKRIANRYIPEFRIVKIGEPSLAAYTVMRTKLDSPTAALEYWKQIVEVGEAFHSDKEHLIVILTNTRLAPIGHHLVSMGSLNETIAHPREILRPALLVAAYGMLIMHNHPSGDPSPSQADHRLTRDIREASNFLRINLLDHVIVGEGETFFSFREAGVL